MSCPLKLTALLRLCFFAKFTAAKISDLCEVFVSVSRLDACIYGVFVLLLGL